MVRSAVLSCVLALAAPLAVAQTSTWVPDTAHSEVDFSVIHMSLSKVRGRFAISGGTIAMNDADITKSTVKMAIDVRSLDTGQEMRDSVLKSSNFFDVDKFPTATFVSTSVAKHGNGLTVNGNLTLNGVTKPVTLEVDGPTGPVSGVDHKPHEGFSATTTLSRLAFGIGANYPTSIVGDEVQLTVDLDVMKQ